MTDETRPAPKKAPAARTHPEDRARIEAGNTLTRLFHGAAITKPQTSNW